MKIIKDSIYGEFRINDPVILDLLRDESITRLKNISQYGIPKEFYFKEWEGYTRFDHSVGVMLLLKKLGASLEEQIAGLLHDVSTLAFSHAADWVFSNGAEGVEDYHDKLHDKIIKRTRLPKILKKYGYSADKISNISDYHILENKIPNLCADRVDYALREFRDYQNQKIVQNYIVNLCVHENEIIFIDKEVAFIFAKNFLFSQTNHWGSRKTVIKFYLLADILKLALNENIISERDFLSDDEEIILKLKNSRNKTISQKLKILKSSDIERVWLPEDKIVKKKFRYVDPKILINNKICRLSAINDKFNNLIKKHRKINERGVLV